MKTSHAAAPTRVIANVDELRREVAAARRAGQTVGVVPTMGALHAGHVSLVDAASRECDLTIVTIFVNPTQFGPGEDFGKYPRRLAEDLELLSGHGAQLVFAPSTESMYAAGHATHVEVAGPALPLEGVFRPGHFRGVATIVLKLFHLVQPDRATSGARTISNRSWCGGWCAISTCRFTSKSVPRCARPMAWPLAREIST